MDDGVEPIDSAPDPESSPGLVDVNGMTLLEMLQARDPQIERSVRRLVDERHHRPDVLLGWSSASSELPPREPTGADGTSAEVDNDDSSSLVAE